VIDPAHGGGSHRSENGPESEHRGRQQDSDAIGHTGTVDHEELLKAESHRDLTSLLGRCEQGDDQESVVTQLDQRAITCDCSTASACGRDS